MEDYRLDFMDFLKTLAIIETYIDILLCAVSIWVTVMIGLMIGWSWRPWWMELVFLGALTQASFRMDLSARVY